MKKILIILVIALIALLAACAADIEIPEDPEEQYTAEQFQQFANGALTAPAGYFHGYANKTSKLEATSFFDPKTGEYQGDIAINTTFSFDGEVAYVGAWYDTPNIVTDGCEISAVVTRVEDRFDKLKVVATCIAPDPEGSHQIVYYLTATGTGNLIRSSE